MKQHTNLTGNNNPPSKTHNVLVVDDEKAVRKVIATILKRSGFEVEKCGNAFDAEDYIRRTEFGVIFLDIKLPEREQIVAVRDKILGIIKDSEKDGGTDPVPIGILLCWDLPSRQGCRGGCSTRGDGQEGAATQGSHVSDSLECQLPGGYRRELSQA